MRLIDADELNEKLERSIEWCRENLSESKASFQSGCIAATKDIINTVLFSKSIDAEPVRHGHWVELWFDEEDRLFGELPSDYKCSVCGGIVPRKTFQSGKYCPNCGAKMTR